MCKKCETYKIIYRQTLSELGINLNMTYYSFVRGQICSYYLPNLYTKMPLS